MISIWFALLNVVISSIDSKSPLTIDDFFNYTSFRSISLSPNGQQLLIHTRRPVWDSNVFGNSLWLYDVNERSGKLITDKLLETVQPRWSPSGTSVAFFLNNISSTEIKSHHRQSSQIIQTIYLYSFLTDQFVSVPIGSDVPLTFAWSNNDSSLYFSTLNTNLASRDLQADEIHWKDVQQYRDDQMNIGSTIHRLDIHIEQPQLSTTTVIANVSFVIGELVYAAFPEQLLFTSVSAIVENSTAFQIYALDLDRPSSITRLTSDESVKLNLQLSNDGQKLLFQTYSIASSETGTNQTQQRLYSVDRNSGQVERWGIDFDGSIESYAIQTSEGVYFLGQRGTNVQVYSQAASNDPSILHPGFNGSYQLIASSQKTIAFVFSSFQQPQETYITTDVNKLITAQILTHENSQFSQFDLPEPKLYQWISIDDNRTIEGIIHYPPGQFEAKNLPLLVLMHGGPADASLNFFLGNWLTWAPLAATQGWLVFEPNYRGSTGYGDQFLNEIRYQPLTKPGKDILSGVDHLIQDGIADPTKLAIGGYSYGGFLTNWLITQTTYFNAAVSGAGDVEHVSLWGLTDFPAISDYLFGGYPWVTPEIYQRESAIYQFNKVRTPTHITSGQVDTRVPVSQSFLLERSLRYLGIPVKLLLLPNEGHPLNINPWHGKIKVREELQWLETYGYNRTWS